MDITRVLIKPILTEKTYAMNSNEVKQYAFLVNPKASKYEIANAFAALYEFKPLKVNTQIRKPAKTRTMSYHPGFTKLQKIAYITLPPGKDISVGSESVETNTKKTEQTVKAKEKGQLKEVKKSEAKLETKVEPKAKADTKKVEKPNK
jgi:large subunit ribosomal protein L23